MIFPTLELISKEKKSGPIIFFIGELQMILKKLLFSVVACHVSILSSTAMDMKDDISKSADVGNVGNWTESFQTKIGDVLHTPNKVSMGFMSSGKMISMDTKLFNDVPISSPIILEVNTTREAFIASMKKSGIID